ncbi:MAG: hypothetical protein J6C62_07240 [Clostridia bacterium]|nr:hypothetical protein [Clostridia bacterium]
MISIQFGDLIPQPIPLWQIWTTVGIYLGVMLAFYVLRSIGVYVLAKRQGIKCKVLAWIPCLWFYVVCKLVGKSRFFGKPIENLALLFVIIFSLSQLFGFVQSFLVNFPLVGNFLQGREILFAQSGLDLEAQGFFEYSSGMYVTNDFVNPYGMGGIQTVNLILSIIGYVSMFVDLAEIVITISVYFALFRKFWPQHHVLASLLTIFLGLFAPFVFVIRKKEPVNYMEYLRSRYNYNPYSNPYGNPYNNPNSYNNPYNNGQSAPKRPEHPFSEFAEKDEVDPGNPFSEFSDKDNKGN